jgi:hypothetical protein
MGPALLPTPLSPACGFRGTLYARRFTAALRRRLCRPALAPVPVPSGAGYDPRIFPLPPGGSAVGFVARLLMVRQCGALPLYRSRPAIPACRLRALAASTVCKLQHPKMPWLSSLHRAAPRHRVERGSKISSSFRVLSRPSEEPIPALDVWRMRLRTESGKSEPADLSTFARNASGQEGISQRFAANGAIYPRSRLARRRRRRAFSLMKPSASCWS